jgi:hypothetical protein
MRRGILLLCSLTVLGMTHAAEEPAPRTAAQLFDAIERTTAQGGNYGLAYVSSIVSLNPCLDAQRVLGADFDREAVAKARMVLPAHGCEDPTFRRLLPRLFFLQALTLAATDDPVRVSAAIERNRKALRACRTVQCGVANLRQAIPELARNWENSQRVAGAMRTEIPDTLRPLADPGQWLAQHAPGVLAQADEWCGRAGLTANMSKPGDGIPTVGVSCDLGDINSPYWTLEQKKQGWVPILAVKSTIGLMPLKTMSGARHPDLKSAVRANMGEHPSTIYRYDGKSYVEILQLDVQSADFGEVAIERIVD